VNCWRNSGDAITSWKIAPRLIGRSTGDVGRELGISMNGIGREAKDEENK
jgi:hypothetical protein